MASASSLVMSPWKRQSRLSFTEAGSASACTMPFSSRSSERNRSCRRRSFGGTGFGGLTFIRLLMSLRCPPSSFGNDSASSRYSGWSSRSSLLI